MSDKEYIKTYKPLIAWLIGFIVISIVVPITLKLSSKISTSITMLIMVLSLYLLMVMIYKGEYVYWINGGPSFEQAKSAGSEKRRQYAKAHLDLFGRMLIVSFFYLLISLLFKFYLWIDILMISLVVIVTAFATVPIKFDK